MQGGYLMVPLVRIVRAVARGRKYSSTKALLSRIKCREMLFARGDQALGPEGMFRVLLKDSPRASGMPRAAPDRSQRDAGTG